MTITKEEVMDYDLKNSIMKKAVDKAVKNKFNVIKALGLKWKGQFTGFRDNLMTYKIWFNVNYPRKTEGATFDIDIYNLVFHTNFIKKLMGKSKGCENTKCEGYTKIRNNKHHIHEHCKAGFKRPGMLCEGDSNGKGGFIGTRPVLYHLQKMADPAISQDVLKLVEYIGTLI